MTELLLKGVALLILYLIGGMAGTLINAAAQERQNLERLSGFVFVATGIFALVISYRWGFPPILRNFLWVIVVGETLFWGWRATTPVPLNESELGPITGTLLHALAGVLYFLGGVALFLGVYKL